MTDFCDCKKNFLLMGQVLNLDTAPPKKLNHSCKHECQDGKQVGGIKNHCNGFKLISQKKSIPFSGFELVQKHFLSLKTKLQKRSISFEKKPVLKFAEFH